MLKSWKRSRGSDAPGCGNASDHKDVADSGFAGGSGIREDPWQIASAEQLWLVRENLTGHYVLVVDIDLSGYENWESIGSFQSLPDASEDAETPHPDYAFMNTFDGAGYAVSNLTVSAETPMGAGLFGCASGTESGEAYIGNFIFENIQVSDFYPVGGAVGLQFMNCKVSDIALKGKKLCGSQGIDGARAGLNADGTTMSPIANCEAIGGSIVAEGNAIWGSGGGVYTDVVVGDPACAVSVECQSEASIEAPSDAA